MPRVRVDQLMPGDVMLGSGETVISVSAGRLTPAGQKEVLLSKPKRVSADGERRTAEIVRRTASWWSAAIVGVKERQEKKP